MAMQRLEQLSCRKWDIKLFGSCTNPWTFTSRSFGICWKIHSTTEIQAWHSSWL